MALGNDGDISENEMGLQSEYLYKLIQELITINQVFVFRGSPQPFRKYAHGCVKGTLIRMKGHSRRR
jgi:hypothetical protein